MQNPLIQPRKSRVRLLTGGVLVLASAIALGSWAWGQQGAPSLAPADGGKYALEPTPRPSAPPTNTTQPMTRPSPSTSSPGGKQRESAAIAGQPAALPTERGDARQIPVPAASKQAAAQANEPGSIEYYRLDNATRNLFAAWQQLAAQRTDLRVAIDEQKAQAAVFASPAVQAQIREQLKVIAGAPATPAGEAVGGEPAPAALAAQNSATASPATAGSEPEKAADTPTSTTSLTLRNLPGSELRPKLEKIYARQLPAGRDASGQWQTITIDAMPQSVVTLAVNHETREVRIAGPQVQVTNWQSIIEALDTPRTAEGVTEVVATKPGYQPYLRRAIDTLQLGGVAARGTAAVASMLLQPGAQPGAGQPNAFQPGFVPPPQQPGGFAPPGSETQAAQGPQVPGGRTALEALGAEGLLGPVDIRFIEGANIVIIRGREQDVQQVMRIIQRIEEITQTSAPEVRIHHLQYVDSISMTALLNRVYDVMFRPRLGEFSITAIGKPNAIMLIGPASTVRLIVEQLITPLDVPVSPQMRFEVFPLRNIPALNAKTAVDAFLLQGAAVTNDALQQTDPAAVTLNPRAVTVAVTMTNSLVVAASARDIAEIAELLRRIDQPPQIAAQVKVFEVVNGDAVSLVQTLQQLFTIGQTGDTPAAPAGYGQAGIVPLLFSVDARTNSIIAVGTFEQLEVVNNILTVLDSADIRQRETRVIRLYNAFAQFIAPAVQTWILQQRDIELQSGIVTPFSLYQRDVIIVPEPTTNNLILSAAPEVIDAIIKNVIDPIDKRPPMVMIQVLIAEIRLSDTDEFGVEFGVQDAVLFNRSLMGLPGFNFLGQPLGNNVAPETLVQSNKIGTQGISQLAVNRINNDLGFGGFVFSAQSESVNVLLRALQEKRRLEILSRPQIMALDAQIAHIEVGQQVPIIQSTQQNTTITGGQTNQYIYEPVGLILDVQPLISPDNRVLMNIAATKSEVGPEAEGIPIEISANGTVLRIPRIDNTTAQTVVSANDGQTVVLGGLITTRKIDVHRRVPLVADIPLIGDLFRFDSVGEERRELLIILTPRVIEADSVADAERLKQIESSRMSWILRDVVSLHGPSGLRDRCDEWFEGEADDIYPGLVPPGGELCFPGDPNVMPMQGPAVPLPAGTAPMNAPQPPLQPAQGDMTKNRYTAPSGAVQPARYETAARTAVETAPSRLPQVK
jgi:type II secretion system protein D